MKVERFTRLIPGTISGTERLNLIFDERAPAVESAFSPSPAASPSPRDATESARFAFAGEELAAMLLTGAFEGLGLGLAGLNFSINLRKRCSSSESEKSVLPSSGRDFDLGGLVH